MLKYNYVILGSPWELYHKAYADIIGHEDVKYIDTIKLNRFLHILYRIHLNKKINSIIPLPGKNIWNKYLSKNFIFQNSKKPLCFLLFSDWFCRETGLVEYIRKYYPTAKIVIMFQDLIATKKMGYSNKPINMDYLKTISDLVISFDFGDADKYKLAYHPIPYSIPKYRDLSFQKKVDVYFLGQAKNRLDRILKTYYQLVDEGVTVNFILANVPKESQTPLPGVRYIDGVGISYEENLKNIENCNCILEIMQKDGTGYTSRTLEAIIYDKKLITNNKLIKNAPFYNPEIISCLNADSDIDTQFIKKIVKVDYKFKEQLSPINLLHFIESKLD